ncbi:hypothetical protein HYU15_02900 [Candidatus Woesearchaeota archaeon]|nr:hypothetical protein [Candidatus Woesearchaeota archaeon]
MLAFIIFITWAALNVLLYGIGPILAYKTAVVTGNPNICKLIPNLELSNYYWIIWRDCVTEVATNEKNPELCHSFLNYYPNDCTFFTAIHLGLSDLCNSFQGADTKAECHAEILLNNNNTIFTKNRVGSSITGLNCSNCANNKICISRCIESRRNKNVCFDMPESNADCNIPDWNLSKCDLEGRELCVSQFAILDRNISYCSEIPFFFLHAKCLADVANYYDYPKYCDSLRDTGVYNTCIDIARERIPSPESCSNSSNVSHCLFSIIIKTERLYDCYNDSECFYMYALYLKKDTYCFYLQSSNFSNCTADREENILDNCTFGGRDGCLKDVTILILDSSQTKVMNPWVCGLITNYWAAAKCYTDYAVAASQYFPINITNRFCLMEISSNGQVNKSYQEYCLKKLNEVNISQD